MESKTTTIRVKIETKERLDKQRRPGQSYDGLFCELLDILERVYGSKQKRR